MSKFVERCWHLRAINFYQSMIIGLENAPAAAAAAAGRGGGVAGFPANKIKSETSKQAANIKLQAASR